MNMLEEQRQRGDMNLVTFLQCARVVIARSGGVFDTSSAWPLTLEKYVLEHLINGGGRDDRETLHADSTQTLEMMGSF